MKVASAHNVFVTPRGAGCGLGGEALAKHGGIVLCFSMMHQILEINTANRYAVVEPGLVISEFQKAVEKVSLSIRLIPAAPRSPPWAGPWL